MTFRDEVEVRRPSVGTKVLMVGFAVFAVLGSFWTIVWFIRAYVEAPRINIAPLALAARESTPPALSAPSPSPAPSATAAPPATSTSEGPLASERIAAAQAQVDASAATSAIADRWLPVAPAALPAVSPDTAPTVTAPPPPAELATAPAGEPTADEVAESSVPAISGA